MEMIEVTLADGPYALLDRERSNTEFGADINRILWTVRVMPEGVRIEREAMDLITLSDILTALAGDASEGAITLDRLTLNHRETPVTVTELLDQAAALSEAVQDALGNDDDEGEEEDGFSWGDAMTVTF
jgi:hypothetical protein